MGIHNVLDQIARAHETGYGVLPDPGNAGVIAVKKSEQTLALATTGAETRTLPVPPCSGLKLFMSMVTDGGDCVVTVTSGVDQADTATITFDTVGDWAELVSIEATPGVFRWRCTGGEGAGVPSGTVTAPTGTFTTVQCTNLDAGASGTAGSVDIFPATASRGKATLACTNQTGDTAVTITVDAMAAARAIHLPDPGKTAYLMSSSAAITPAEADVLSGVTAGTAAASKAVVLNSASHISAVKTAALSLGASGSETLVTATAAQLNAMGATVGGLAAILAGGLGGSQAIAKTLAATTTVIAAHGSKDRACLVVVTVDETYAIGTGTLPTVKIGEDDTIEKCMAATVLDTEAAGTVLVFAFTNTATKKIIVTSTAAVGNSTGGCTVTVLAIPTT